MSAATARAKARIEAPPKEAPPTEAATEIHPLCFADTSDIPSPVPHIMPTREQFERSRRVSLAQANAGMGEDFEVVQPIEWWPLSSGLFADCVRFP